MSAQAYEEEQGGGALETFGVMMGAVLLAIVLSPLVLPVVLFLASRKLAERREFWYLGTAEEVIRLGKVWGTVAGVAIMAVLWNLYGLNKWTIGAGALVGVLFLPGAMVLSRAFWAQKSATNRIPDVRVGSRVKRARYEGARARTYENNFYSVSASGVVKPMEIGEPTTSPDYFLGKDNLMLGEVIKPVRSWDEWTAKESLARSWRGTSGDKDAMTLPEKPAQARAMVLAESGAGKSFFLRSLALCADQRGWQVTFVDGKGDPEDSRALAEVIPAKMYSQYDFWRGSREEIVERLGTLYPESGGDGDYYRNRFLNAVRAVQAKSPVRSYGELVERLRTPGPHASERNVQVLTRESGGKMSLAEEAQERLETLFAGFNERGYFGSEGWSFESEDDFHRLVPIQAALSDGRTLGKVILADLRVYMQGRLEMPEAERTPELIIIDEFGQLVDELTDPAEEAKSLFEVARQANLGLIIASQSADSLSTDERLRKALFASGATVFAGRSADPEELSNLSGTHERLEAGGDANGRGLAGGRSQHTYNLPPEWLRKAAAGEWLMIETGSVTPFFAFPPTKEKLY